MQGDDKDQEKQIEELKETIHRLEQENRRLKQENEDLLYLPRQAGSSVTDASKMEINSSPSPIFVETELTTKLKELGYNQKQIETLIKERDGWEAGCAKLCETHAELISLGFNHAQLVSLAAHHSGSAGILQSVLDHVRNNDFAKLELSPAEVTKIAAHGGGAQNIGLLLENENGVSNYERLLKWGFEKKIILEVLNKNNSQSNKLRNVINHCKLYCQVSNVSVVPPELISDLARLAKSRKDHRQILELTQGLQQRGTMSVSAANALLFYQPADLPGEAAVDGPIDEKKQNTSDL